MPLDYNYTGTEQSIVISQVDGLQADLDLKAPIESPTFTGTVAGITKAMVGLGNVDDTSDADKPISNTTLQALNFKAPIASPTFTGTVAGITKAMVGLSAVDNTSDADKPVSTAGQSALDLKANQTSISNIDNTSDADKPVSNATQTALDLKANQTSISNIDNTSDANKPVSNATQTALDLKQNLLNTSDLFLDTSVANQPKLGLGTSTPSSTSGGDTCLQLYGATDVALSIKRGGGGDWEFKCNNPSGSLSVYNGGSHRAEWTNTEFELKQGLTVKGAVIDMEALPTSAQTGTTKLWNNSGALNIGAGASGGGGGGGVCLESIQALCQGGTINTIAGNTLTIPNISAVIKPAQTGGHTILASIDYEPPSGTKSVMLTFKMFIGWNGNNGSCNALFDCRVNSTFYSGGVISSQSFIRSNTGMGEVGEYSINCLMNVDSSIGADDLPNGKIKTWNTPYTFNFASSRTIQNSEVFLCSNNPHPYNTATDKFIVPMILIKAFS